MRTLIVLSLVAVACADKLGYNYQPVGHSDEGLSFQPGASSGEAVLSQPIQEAHAPAPVAPAPAVEEYEKEFYSYSAPDHEFEDHGHQNVASSVKKALRVIFIKGPETKGVENAAVQLARSSGEERTAIYVLQKQADVGNLAQQLQQIHSQTSSKPEVHFVKYRTQADAQNAQQAIQAQYNSLPGTSRSSNEGTAPVLNFASQAPAAPAPQQQSAQSPQQNYLPPSLRRFRFRF